MNNYPDELEINIPTHQFAIVMGAIEAHNNHQKKYPNKNLHGEDDPSEIIRVVLYTTVVTETEFPGRHLMAGLVESGGLQVLALDLDETS